MNESQEKPRKKWYKKWQFILAAILLMAAIGYVLALSLHGQIVTCPPCGGYECVKDEFNTAVGHFGAGHQGSLPILNMTYTNANCSNCHVINMSALLITNGGVFKDVPLGIWEGPATMDDNCDSLAGHISGCSASNHYIWIVDTNANVFSYCIGTGCTTNNSGYQNVWP